MPSGLSGSDYYRSNPPSFYKNFRNQDLNPEIGVGALLLLLHTGSAATVRTATKKAVVLNGSSQYASKTSQSNFTPNGSEILTNGDFESTFSSGLATGWGKEDTDDTFAQETTIVHAGSNSQKVTASGASTRA